MILTEEEMINVWLLRKGFEPLRSDCRITRSDGADLREIARLQLRQWYLNLLLTADPDILIPHQFSLSRLVSCRETPYGSLSVTLPADVLRIIDIRHSALPAPTRIVEADSELARKQFNPFSAAGPTAPVAVRNGRNAFEFFGAQGADTDSTDIALHPTPFSSILCICLPEDDDQGNPRYELTQAAINLI